MTRDEFEVRFDVTPDLKMAELIEGIVYITPKPIPLLTFGEPCAHLIGWLAQYDVETPGVEGGAHAHIRLDAFNEPQPEVSLIIRPECGGAVRIVNGMVEGPPELVTEVTYDTPVVDPNTRLYLYRRHGIREYIRWRTTERTIDWFALHGERYERLPSDSAGVIRSEVFPGLWLDTDSMLRNDPLAVRQCQELGNASPEHARFAARLRQLHVER